MGEIFNTLLVNPIINILVIIYQILNYIHIPYALSFSIILMTVFIRFVLYPFTSAQLKVSKKMQEIAPHISKLKEKHKNDAKTLQAETMKLYKEFGVNPAAGCLPMLIQLPIIWALYSVFQKIITLKPEQVVNEINNIIYFPVFKLNTSWDQTFFNVNLAHNPQGLLNTMGPVVLLIPILTAVFQFLQSKMMAPKKTEKPKEKTEKKKEDDFASAFQTQSTYIFPLMIGFFSFSFPIGLSLYWNTFTIFGILQQYKVSGWGGLEPLIDKIKGIKNNG